METSKKVSPREKEIEYICNSCLYPFKRKESINVTVCPYCGKRNSVEPKSLRSAQALLDEAIERDSNL
ncbi:MAG: hypothetical protein PHG05_03285 [Candidatus Nanoarchaeia archaeon]|nr:hypothetical protein [Candidatus Nanoarchaeia archaeon]